MENITSYFTTILCVFICLSSVFIFTQLARVFINKKKINQKLNQEKDLGMIEILLKLEEKKYI